MAFHLSSASHSHLCADKLPPLYTTSSYQLLQFNPSPFSWRPTSFFSHKLNQSQIPKASLSLQQENSQTPPPSNSTSPSRNNVWVNPKNPKASHLRQRSYDARYSSLIKYSQALNSCNPSQEDVFQVLNGLGENPIEQDAVIILNNMDNPETATLALKFFQEKMKPSKRVILYNVVMKVFKKCRSFDKAELLFEEMLQRGLKPDNITFTTMIGCARMSYLPNKAVELFERMSEYGCEPDDVTYSTMIDAYGRIGSVDMALSLYDKARTKRSRIDMVTFATLIKIYTNSGNYDGALNVYEEMKALGVKPNLVVYNMVLDSMGRAKRPWQAKSFYMDLIKNGLVPNSATYTALLRAYCRARYGRDALSVYREMKEKGIELNVVLYNSVLAMCADVGLVEECIEIFDDMKRSVAKPDSWTFSSLITTYSCSGKVTEAENVFNEMIEAGCKPDLLVLTSLIQGYGKANQIDGVVKIFNLLQELGITPDDRFHGCLLGVMNNIHKEDLGKLVACIEQSNPMLGDVVTLLMKEETVDEVFKEKANELFASISKGVRRAFCNCLIDLCINLNLLERARVLLDLGLTQGIYRTIQVKSPEQWSLQLKSLSLGAALTAFRVWTDDLSKTLEQGENLPPILGINTGHGKSRYSNRGMADFLESHFKESKAPFYENKDKAGWFLTTDAAAKSWLEARKSPEVVAA